MKTRRLDTGPVGIAEAADIIQRGGLVAFPTETVYGLGANALDADALRRIFEAKQRPTWDPIIVHCADVKMSRELVLEWPDSADALAQKFWPGPLTLLLPKRDVIPDVCTAGREKVGIRIPQHATALALIRAAGVPIAAPSANRFGHTSPTSAEHVLRDLDGRIDAILDGGKSNVGVESTVLDPTIPIIYRPGGVSREQIEEVIGPVEVAKRPVVDTPAESLESPGLGIRHYAPKAEVVLVESEHEMSTRLHELIFHGKRCGYLLPQGWREPNIPEALRADWGRWNDLESLARELYTHLRELDARGADVIVCPMPPATGIGLAIRDRLTKASK